MINEFIKGKIEESKQNKSNKLDLSNMSLSLDSLTNLIPYIAQELPELTELNLSNNRGLRSLPDYIKNLENLKKLRLSNCSITSLPTILPSKLNYLDVHLNPLSFKSLMRIIFIGGGIINVVGFQSVLSNYNYGIGLLLGINSGVISNGNDYSKDIKLHKALINAFKPMLLKFKASFPDKRIEEYEVLFRSLNENQFIGIGLLNISLAEAGIGPDLTNNISRLPEISSSLSRLIEAVKCINDRCGKGNTLDLKKNHLITSRELELLIPYLNLFLSKYITKISLSGENLTTLPYNIVRLSKRFKSLEIVGGQFKELPKNFGECTFLQELSIRNTKITTLPKSFGDLNQLTKLDLSGNKSIISLPDSIGNLPNLSELYLKSTNIISLPSSEGMFLKLKELSISNTKITTLPKSFGDLNQLTKLDLSGNKSITSLPDSIGNLPNLSELYVRSTNIISLPSSEGKFLKLKELDLRGAIKIQSYKGLNMFPELEKLYLTKNPIFLKELLYFSPTLKVVGLRENCQRIINQFNKNPEESSESFRKIVTSVLNIYPDTTIEDFDTLFLRLNTDQIRGVFEFKLPLSELGIGIDDLTNKLSNELNIGITLFDRFRRADEIKKELDMSSKEALSLVEKKSEYLQFMLDFGLSEAQLDRVPDFKKERESIYTEIISKIINKNNPDKSKKADEVDLKQFYNLEFTKEFTEEDKALAAATFDEIYKPKPKRNNDLNSNRNPAKKDRKILAVAYNKRQKQLSDEDNIEQVAQPTVGVPVAASLPAESRESSSDNSLDMNAMILPYSMLRRNHTNSDRKRAAKDSQKDQSLHKRQKQLSDEDNMQPTVGVPVAASLPAESLRGSSSDNSLDMNAMTQPSSMPRRDHTNSDRKPAAKYSQKKTKFT